LADNWFQNLEERKIAAIFPAFGCKYLGNEREALYDHPDLLSDLISRAKRTVNLDAPAFLSCMDGNFEDELQSQYAAYLYSSALSQVIKRSGICVNYAAGYSMGLYAALYHAESITFEQGLELIYTAYKKIIGEAQKIRFGAGVISGLELRDVSKILEDYQDLEIINVNNRLNFLIAGYERNVQKALSIAREQGALNAKLLSFISPYHSRFMEGAARDLRKYLESIKIKDPKCPIISTIDQREITSNIGVINDLADNICRNINWLNTMTRMIDAGVSAFIECGPGKSLYKISRFIEGNYLVYTSHTLSNFISDRMEHDRLFAASSRI
jgi:[acyl-carrier-protein] S-malonyltransferase